MNTETVPGFWKRMADRRAQAEGYADADSAPTLATAEAEDPHKRHRRMSMRRLWGVCEDCFEKKLRWMGRQPKAGHAYRAYVRLCHTYGREP